MKISPRLFSQKNLFKPDYDIKSYVQFSGIEVIRLSSHQCWLMFLGLSDPDPDPLVRGTDPGSAPDPSLFS